MTELLSSIGKGDNKPKVLVLVLSLTLKGFELQLSYFFLAETSKASSSKIQVKR